MTTHASYLVSCPLCCTRWLVSLAFCHAH